MSYPQGDDRRLDGSWGWDVAVLLTFVAMIAVALWAYHGGDRPVSASRHHFGVQRRKYASATRQRKRKGRQLTRRACHPLRLRYVFGAWRRQRLRSAQAANLQKEHSGMNIYSPTTLANNNCRQWKEIVVVDHFVLQPAEWPWSSARFRGPERSNKGSNKGSDQNGA